jgi:hypothetical protein
MAAAVTGGDVVIERVRPTDLRLPLLKLRAAGTLAGRRDRALGHGVGMLIDGLLVDLDQPRFHDLHPEFHIHPGHGNRWHHHPGHLGAMLSFERLTLHQALSAIGLDLSGDTFTFDETAYDTTDPAVTVTVRISGAEVNRDAHVIGDGEHITVEITTSR